MTPRLKELYYKEIQPALKKILGFKNTYQGPKVVKVVIQLLDQAQTLDCLKVLDLRNNACLDDPETRRFIQKQLPNTTKIIF